VERGGVEALAIATFTAGTNQWKAPTPFGPSSVAVESAPNQADAAGSAPALDPAAWVHPSCREWKGMFHLRPVPIFWPLAVARGDFCSIGGGGEQQCAGTERLLHGDPGQPGADRP